MKSDIVLVLCTAISGLGTVVLYWLHSPYLTPMGFYVWRHIKELDYYTPVLSEMDLVATKLELLLRNLLTAAVLQAALQQFRISNERGDCHVEHSS